MPSECCNAAPLHVLGRHVRAVHGARSQRQGECLPYLVVRHRDHFAHVIGVEELSGGRLEHSQARAGLTALRPLGLLRRLHTRTRFFQVDLGREKHGQGIPEVGRPADQNVAQPHYNSGRAATIHILSEMRLVIIVRVLMMVMMTLVVELVMVLVMMMVAQMCGT